ncbi:MAG: gliding motility-associated C-terminal domain-containing protein [Saprospiraceae bacterium]|nr:gliding motility-associated C-terminal domain-containing protein [Candidatus Vicinibacter affinis]
MKMNHKSWLYIISMLFFFSISGEIKASHIVGGEMTYRCLGGNRYEVRLTLRRDCFNGSPEAEFDDPANIGIFDGNGVILRDLGKFGVIQMPFRKDDTLNEILKTECEVVGGDVCVHTTTYIGNVTLPYRNGGYQLVYQRCCRNKTITNIVDPELVGATYTVIITEDALRYCNVSPTFGEWPAVYICGDRPILFNHSVKDQEGDSLVYSLCIPYSGADTANSKPSTPKKPPYIPVTYKAPYGLFNLLGGFPELTIDRNTGLLKGQPNLIGQYLVGICISEYRNGRLLSQLRRDFQYNVRICTTNPVSNFDADNKVLCTEDRRVNFTSKSINAKDYTWFFDYPSPLYTSKDSITNFTYLGPGKYRVALIAKRAKDCIDTSYQDILVYDSTQLDARFDLNFGSCDDSININIVDRSFDSLLNIKNYSWEVKIGSKTYSSSQMDPKFTFIDTGQAHIRLLIESEGGCIDSLAKDFYLNRLKPQFLGDVIPICIGESTTLISNPDARFKYSWSPPNGLSCNDCPNPIANPDSTTTYFVTVTDGQCEESDTLTVKVSRLLDIDIQGDTIICQDTIKLRANGGVESSIEWSDQKDFSNIIQNGDFEFSSVVKGKATFFVRAKSAANCPGSDSITVRNEKIITDVPNQFYKFCEQDTFELTLNNARPEHQLIYVWTPNTYVVSGQGTNKIKGYVPACEDQRFVINVENQYRCRAMDTIDVDIRCKPKASFRVDKNCDNTLVSFINESDQGLYTWEFGDNNSSSDINPVHNYKDTGSYIVTLRVKGECNNEITKFINVGFIKVNLNDTILSCNGDSVNINPDPDLNYKYKWTPADNLSDPDSPNPLVKVNSTTTYTVRVTDPNVADCFIERNVTVFVPPLINLRVNNDTVLCYSDTILLQAFTDAGISAKVEWLNEVGQFIGDGYKLVRSFADSQYIRAYATDLYGCTDVDSFKVIPIKTKYEIIGKKNLCPGADGFVEFIPKSNHTYKYSWSPSRFIVSGEQSDRILVKPSDTTIFYVDFENEYGCRYQDSFQVNISKFDPPLDAYADDDTIYLGQSTTLHVNGDFSGYKWVNPQGLSCIECTDPVASPLVSTLYKVTAINDDGCPGEAEVRVFVIRPNCDETDVFISNIFSPNGDNNNDEFRIRSNFLDQVELYVYDRWGEKIFETKDKNFWWDGTYKGGELPPDVYGYYFKVVCVDGQTYFKKGNVTLVR